MLWTGGKDSCLAYYRAREAGYQVVALATFVPASGEEQFKAHPQAEMRLQAEALGVPIHFLEVKPPYRQGYQDRLRELREALGLTAVITGDIDRVDGHPNWIADCCAEIGLEAVFPLWQEPRPALMAELLRRGLKVEISWLNHPALPRELRGRIIDSTLLTELTEICSKVGIDLCGENGEYHTMVRLT